MPPGNETWSGNIQEAGALRDLTIHPEQERDLIDRNKALPTDRGVRKASVVLRDSRPKLRPMALHSISMQWREGTTLVKAPKVFQADDSLAPDKEYALEAPEDTW